jgi:hypothetical protein
MESHSLELEIYLKFMIFQHHRVLQNFVDRAFNSIRNVFAILADRNRSIVTQGLLSNLLVKSRTYMIHRV